MLNRWIILEKQLVELESQIAELEHLNESEQLDLSDKIEELREEHRRLLEETVENMSPWDRVQIARHPKRPYALDYIQLICSDFVEVHGDRRFADDAAVVGGLAKIEGRSIVIIGYQKGRDVRERQARNFGAPMPEGLRKAERLMRLADKFGKPILTLVDTPGAACLVGAEERGISEAIAQNQLTMSQLRVPIIVAVIGEGCSGGAIAIAAGDRVLMLEHAYYSVISPEGCASILWRDASKAPDAATTLRLSARDAISLGIVDEILPEPLGGAHREPSRMAETMRAAVLRHLHDMDRIPSEELIEQRYKKYRKMGSFSETKLEKSAPPIKGK